LCLRESQYFTKLIPSIIVFLGYGLALYLLTIIIHQMPLGIAYALWSGLGLSIVTILGAYLYQESLDTAAWLGIVMILAGVITIRVFSKSTII
jgi:small multidrug resistance pump